MATKSGYILDSELNSKQSFKAPPNSDFLVGSIERLSGSSRFKLWVQKLSIETGGIERVTDEERAQNTSKVWNACTFW